MNKSKALTVGIKEMSLTIESMNDTICELKAANIELRKSNDAAAARYDEMQKEVQRLRKLYSEQEDELLELKEDYRDKCEALRSRDLIAKQMAEQIDMGADRAREAADKAHADLTVKDLIIEALKVDIHELRERVEATNKRAEEAVKLNGHIATKASEARKVLELEIVGYKNSERLHREEIERQQHMIDHLRSELDVERKNHVHTQNLSSMAKNRADDCERYKQFYFLLRELVGRKENT